MEIARLRVVLEADTRALDSALAAAPGRARAAVEAAAGGIDSVGERMSRMGAAVSSVGARMTAGVTAPLVGIGVAAINVAAQYERAMDVFASTSNATAAQMRAVGDMAQKLGSDLTLPNTSAKDAVDAMLELTKAGLSVDNAMAAARGSIQLAATENMGVARAAEIAANALNMWNLPGREASRVADMLAAAAASSSGGVTDMAVAMRNGGAAFAGAKVPMDAFMTSVGLLAKNGIQGSLAGTGLRSMLLRLTAPTDEAAKTMQRLGIQIFDAQGQMRPWRDIVVNLQTAFRGLGDEQRQMAMKTIFGTYAIQSANVLIREGAAGYDAMNAAVNRSGAAAEMAGAQNRGLLGALDALKSAAETLAISLTPYLTTLANIVRSVAEWVSSLNNVSPAMRNVIVVVGLAAAALGPLLSVAGSVLTVIGGISSALPAIGAGLTALTGPVGAVVIALGALGLAYTTNFAGFRDAVNSALAPAMPVLRDIGALLAELGQRYGPTIRAVLIPAFQLLGQAIGNFVTTAATGLRGILQLLNGDFRAGFSSVGTALMQGMANGVMGGQSLVTNAIIAAARTAVAAAKSVLGIRSPSAVFAEIGQNSAEGFVKGMVDYTPRVASAAAGMGSAAADAASGASDPFATTTQRTGYNRKVYDIDYQGLRMLAESAAASFQGVAGNRSAQDYYQEMVLLHQQQQDAQGKSRWEWVDTGSREVYADNSLAAVAARDRARLRGGLATPTGTSAAAAAAAGAQGAAASGAASAGASVTVNIGTVQEAAGVRKVVEAASSGITRAQNASGAY